MSSFRQRSDDGSRTGGGAVTPGAGGGGIFAGVDADEAPILNPEVGQTVGDFRLVQQIGEGGMASVFRAERVSTGEPSANMPPPVGFMTIVPIPLS